MSHAPALNILIDGELMRTLKLVHIDPSDNDKTRDKLKELVVH